MFFYNFHKNDKLYNNEIQKKRSQLEVNFIQHDKRLNGEIRREN